MRTVSGTLDTAETSLNRYPIQRVTIRDIRLRFALFTTQSNPVGASDDTTYSEQITTPGGLILRAITSGTTVYVSRSTPGTAGSWATWTNLGFASQAGSQLGLAINSTDIYLFYMSASDVLNWVKSTDDGVTFGAPTSTALTYTGPCNIAPASKDEVFVMHRIGSGAGASFRISRAFNNSGWTTSDMPWSLFGDPIAGADWLANGALHFDAEKVGTTTCITYTNRFYGLSYVTVYDNGLYSNPQALLPDDYTKFYIGHMSKIQGRLWLTGRIKRDNSDAYSPDFDAYIYSDDGINWTALARDSFLCIPAATTVQGKIHLPGDGYVYYSGARSVYRAPSSYLIDPAGDPAASKIILGTAGGQYDDFISAAINYPAAGTSPDMDLQVASGDDAYFPGNSAVVDKSGIAKVGSDIVVEAGYLTSAQPTLGEMITLFRGNIDQVTLDIADGLRDAKITARDALYKHMRDYVSPFAWDIGSQLKSYDAMAGLNNFAIQSGTWVSLGSNMVTNPGFEGSLGTTGWTNYSNGTATGLRAISTDDYNSGLASYRLEKTGGASTDKWGTYYTISAVAGTTYNVGLQIHCSVIVGAPLEYTLEAAGNYGVAGAAASVTTVMSDSLSFWTGMSLSFTAQVTASVKIYFYFSNCTTGTICIDDLLVQDSSPGYLSFKFDNAQQEGVLFSTQPPMLDFDITMRTTDVNSAAPASQIGAGLVGLATDVNNFVILTFGRSGGSTYLKLLKRRNSSYINLTTPYTVSASDVQSNTPYDIRLVHKGGQFWGYVKTAASTSWGAPKINYVWSGTDGVLCNSIDGKGKVGIRVAILPLAFHAYGIDQFSDTICLRASNDGDFTGFTGSGNLLWESERISYTSKTSTAVLPAPPAFIDGTDTPWQACGTDQSSYQCRFSISSGQLGWDGFVQLANIISPAAHQYGGAGAPNGSYGIVFIKAAEPYSSWKITETVVDLNGAANTIEIQTDNTAHANTNNVIPGRPSDHVWLPGGYWTMSCQIAPALMGCLRGQTGTAAVKHPDNSRVLQFPDDEVRINSFTIFDSAVDYSHEALLRRIAAMSGIMNCSFDTREQTSTVSITSVGVWGSTTLKDWNGVNFTGMTGFELSFDIAALTNGQGFGVMWWGNYVSYITYATGTGYSAGWSLGAPDAGDPKDETHILPIQPPVGQALHIRFVAAHGAGTMYINGMIASNFTQLALTTTDVGTIILWGIGTGISFTNLHVPDLLSWREWAIINSGEDTKSSLTNIIGDRPIYMSSLSGASLKFSSFDRRSDLGTFANTIYADSQSPDDSEIATWYRVETENIIESVDPVLSAKYGLLHRHLAMNQASTAEAAFMMNRLIRRTQEAAGARSQTMPANLTFEIEDKFTANFTASGSGLPVNEVLIVNDLRYQLGLSLFEMQLGVRKFIS